MDALASQMRFAPLHDLFEAWRVGEAMSPRLDTLDATTLAEARDHAASSCSHKDHFLVKQTDRATGRATLHLFYVKQKAATWLRDPATGIPKQVRPLEAEHRFSVPVEAFAPVEPWRWSPGCDVVGIDRSMVEG